MGFFSNLFNSLKNARSRRENEEAWNERFTNDPENPPRNLPLDDNPNSHLPR